MSFLALAYLAVPALLFLIFFVKPVIGLVLATALAAVTAHTAWQSRHDTKSGGTSATLAVAAVAACLTLGVLALMGFVSGHFSWDWIKHWALLNTLSSEPWPVQIELQGAPAYLRFYIGAYLVPAGIAHLSGWSLAVCTAMWYGLGLTLAFMLIGDDEAGSGLQRLSVLPLLLLMGGADAWLQRLQRIEGPLVTITGFHHEWWADPWLDHPLQYGSPLSLLLWVPHQAIPALMAVGLLCRLRTPASLAPTAMAIGMLALWSPYALIGTVILLMGRIAGSTALQSALRRPDMATIGAAATATAFAALMAWTLLHQLPAGGLDPGRVWSRLAQPAPYLLFLTVELAIPLLILRRRMFEDATSVAALLTLIVLPWVGGAVPDAVMRISMPALIYLFARSAQEIARQPLRRFAPGALAVMVLSGPTVWGEASYHAERARRHVALPDHDPLAAPHYTVWARHTRYTASEFFETCGWNWRPQYFSTTPPPSWPQPADR
jgi:hypothetical protein